MTSQPSSWTEVFKFSVQIKGGSVVEFAGITEDITGLEFDKKDFESVALANGGRVEKWKPQEDESATFKIWPLPGQEANLTGGGFNQLIHPQTTADSTEPLVVANTRNRNKHQFVVLWATGIEALASATTATGTGNYAHRITVKNAYITELKPMMEDKTLGSEVTFKWTPFDRDGTSNKTVESTTGTTQLSAVTSFS